MTVNHKEFGLYLRNVRKEKGLTLRKIEELSGVSNAYLSQLENGKRGIPSPDILKKINGPLGISYDELMEKAGHISADARADLHPKTVETMQDGNLTELITNASELFFESITDSNGILKDEYRNMIAKELVKEENGLGLSEEEANEFLDNPEVLNQIFNHLTLEEKISFLNFLIEDFVERKVDINAALNISPKIEKGNSAAMLRVPVLGYIAAGQPIFAEDQIEEWMDIPNLWNLKEKEAIVLKVKGDSMIGSRIYEGDRVIVKLQPNVENGEIAVVNVSGDEATLKKVKKTDSGQVILYPDNPNYEPIFVENENARVIGKVVQVMFEPK